MKPTLYITKIINRMLDAGKEITLDNFFKEIKLKNPSEGQKEIWGSDLENWRKQFRNRAIKLLQENTDYYVRDIEGFVNTRWNPLLTNEENFEAFRIWISHAIDEFLENKNKTMTTNNDLDRDLFMNFFRNTNQYNQLTPDDKAEIFVSALHGSSDVTVEIFEEVLENYNVHTITVSETSTIACFISINESELENILDLTDEKFYQEAQENGLIYNLEDLADAFNQEEINTATDQMRLIKVKNI